MTTQSSKIRQEVQRRGITRLCHFTQSRNLSHILGDCPGILSRQSLEQADLPHNPTDPDRWDGHNDLVCCSLEFPNVYYFQVAQGRDRLFRDWVVLLIKPDFLWQSGTLFCPCNAARDKGAYIQAGYKAFLSLFDSKDTRGQQPIRRSPYHLQRAPTNLQAEILVPDPIPLDCIQTIVVKDKAQKDREVRRLELQKIPLRYDIWAVPECFDRVKLPKLIQGGCDITAQRVHKGSLC